MAFDQDWISLRFLLILLMPIGKGMVHNQLEICAAVTAGLVRIRLTGPYIGENQRLNLEGRTIHFPNDLSPEMLDWERSVPRPGFGWRIDPPLDPPWNSSVSFYLELNYEDLEKIWGALFKAGFSYSSIRDKAKVKTIKEIIASQKTRLAVRNRPGGGGVKAKAAINAMVEAVHDARVTYTQFRTMKQKELSVLYPGAGRTTLAASRETALRRLQAEGYADTDPAKP